VIDHHLKEDLTSEALADMDFFPSPISTKFLRYIPDIPSWRTYGADDYG